MLKKLRKRLTLIYTLCIGTVVTVIVIGTLMINENQLEQRSLEAFQSSIDSIVYKMQTDTAISATWLAQTEINNRFIIHIEDAGRPFLFSGAWQPKMDRTALIEKTKALALAEGVDTTAFPVSAKLSSSSILKFKGEDKEEYYGYVTVLPSTKGWKSLTLIRNVPNEKNQIIRQRLLFAALDIIALAALYIINWYFVGKALAPVEESRKQQAEFVAAASHELRSPLAVIQANASALQMDVSQASRFLPGIEQECRRMARLIDDMLILASADAKTWSVMREIIETDTFLIECYELFLPLCQKKSQKLNLVLPDEALHNIAGDRQRLEQTILILLDNAMQYTQSNGKITMSAYEKGKTLSIAIEDNGPGIPDEMKTHIFERFFRIDKARNKKNHFGLGLSIASELIRLHEGHIYLKDTNGGGSTFIIELPINP